MRALVIILLASHVVFAAGLREERAGTITLERRQKRGTNARIEGVFHSNEGGGIRFKTSLKSLVIQALDGDVMVNVSTLAVRMQSYGDESEVKVFQVMDEAYLASNENVYRVHNSDALIASEGIGRELTHYQLHVLGCRENC